MGPTRTEAAARAVEAVRRRFEEWRGEPRRSRRIPEDLWRAAADVAGENGVWRTARALGLNGHELKERLLATRKAGGSTASPFVELSPPAMAAGAECVVEFEDCSGTRLRIRLPGWIVPDLVALAREFRRSER